MKVILILSLMNALTFAAKGPVAKDKFVNEIPTVISNLFCESKTYFRQCFSSSEDECKTTAKASAEGCAKEVSPRIPASIENKEEGGKWGREIGSCAGIKFETQLVSKRISSAECKDQAKWK